MQNCQSVFHCLLLFMKHSHDTRPWLFSTKCFTLPLSLERCAHTKSKEFSHCHYHILFHADVMMESGNSLHLSLQCNLEHISNQLVLIPCPFLSKTLVCCGVNPVSSGYSYFKLEYIFNKHKVANTFNYHAMKMNAGVGVQLHTFLILILHQTMMSSFSW